MMFRAVFWVILPFTRQYNPEDSSEHRFYFYWSKLVRLECLESAGDRLAMEDKRQCMPPSE
jgi:hypothetical protein